MESDIDESLPGEKTHLAANNFCSGYCEKQEQAMCNYTRFNSVECVMEDPKRLL
jgi:hypothetical protein